MRGIKFHLLLLLFYFAQIINSNAQTSLENDYLEIKFDKSGALTFRDKVNNQAWGRNHVGWIYLSDNENKYKVSLSTIDFEVVKQKDSLIFSFTHLNTAELKDPEFQLKGSILLDGKSFVLNLTEVKTSLQLEDIEYPAHLLHVTSGADNGYVVVPHLQGIMIPSRYDAGFMRYGQNIWDLICDKEIWWDFESGNLNMPWFGAQKGNSSVMVKVNTSSDCVLLIFGNHVIGEDGFPKSQSYEHNKEVRLSSLTPIWKSIKKRWGYARSMTVQLVEDGYVGMAKAYKEDAKISGRYVTLKEKIAMKDIRCIRKNLQKLTQLSCLTGFKRVERSEQGDQSDRVVGRRRGRPADPPDQQRQPERDEQDGPPGDHLTPREVAERHENPLGVVLGPPVRRRTVLFVTTLSSSCGFLRDSVTSSCLWSPTGRGRRDASATDVRTRCDSTDECRPLRRASDDLCSQRSRVLERLPSEIESDQW